MQVDFKHKFNIRAIRVLPIEIEAGAKTHLHWNIPATRMSFYALYLDWSHFSISEHRESLMEKIEQIKEFADKATKNQFISKIDIGFGP